MKKAIILIILSIPFFAYPQLTGFWKTDVGGCYQLRQDGNEVWWAGEDANDPRAKNVFYGILSGRVLTGIWCDMPTNVKRGCGQSISLRLEGSNTIVKTEETAPYYGSVWTRQNGPCKGAATTTQQPGPGAGAVWEVIGYGEWRGTWTQRGNTNIYDGFWKRGYLEVTTEINMTISGTSMTAERYKSSDNQLCNFTGTISADGRSMSGDHKCGGNPTIPWSATLKK